MATQDKALGDRLYEEQLAYARDEQKRRSASTILIRGKEVAAREKGRFANYIVDPRLGFNNRTHRFWTNTIPAGGEEGQVWKWLGHRHTIEAVIFWLNGHGHSIIDGIQYDWKAGDLISVPMFAWHRHVNTSDEPVSYVASTTGPLSMGIGLAVYEDENYPEYWVFAQEGEEATRTLVPGGRPEVPNADFSSAAAQVYLRQLNFAAEEEERRRASKVLVRGDELTFQPTPMGRVAYAIDPSSGFHVKAMGSVVAEITPGKHSGAHRHLYDEIDYVVAGEGRVVVEDQTFDIEQGDTIAVPVFAWHQYFATGSKPLRILAHHTRPAMEALGLTLTQHGEISNDL
jgi:gentisate 1,2-dioxygenase